MFWGVRIWEFTQETAYLKFNYRHRIRQEPLGNGSDFIFEEVNKDLRRIKKKEELSSKFKELFLRKEKSKKKNSIKCRVRGPFSLRHLVSKGFPGGASGKESACQCRRHKR